MRKYLGLPYEYTGRDLNGLDCYGLLLLIYREELGIKIPDYEYNEKWYKEGRNYYVEGYYELWKKIEKEALRRYDPILFKHGSDIVNHVGIYLEDKKFIHIDEGGIVEIVRLDSKKWKNKIYGYFRYVGESVD